MENKVALITGCSSGIGREFSRQLFNSGWKVFATARKTETLQPLADLGCETIRLDVTSREQIREVIKKILHKEKKIDLLINNAGYGLMGPAIEIPYEELVRQFDTNLFGAVELIKEVIPDMIDNKSGIIVNIGSISGITATPFSAPYCASKAAVHAFSDSLRMELKPFGIKVITVQPGAIKSNFGENADVTVSNVLSPDSFYSSIQEYVHKRAKTSQESTTPVDVFVKNVLKKTLQKNPPSVIRTGKKSFLLPTLKKILSTKMLDKILMKTYGLNKLSLYKREDS
ncbi:MAG: SDR family NAD(P)-dependent oxidoreductase [Prolixibacteraceae bacterium]|nr:SDR family NAD(P)-dependent oxidoreductase [Prolixibacteraceae bacterium]